MGLFVVYFGATCQYPKVAHHTIWLGETYQTLLENIFDKKETFLFGQVITEPTMIWKSYEEGKMITGWNCKLHTNSSITGDEVVLDVQLVYDLIKWEPVRMNSFVKLSVQGEQSSRTTESGKILKCNVVVRK